MNEVLYLSTETGSGGGGRPEIDSKVLFVDRFKQEMLFGLRTDGFKVKRQELKASSVATAHGIPVTWMTESPYRLFGVGVSNL